MAIKPTPMPLNIAGLDAGQRLKSQRTKLIRVFVGGSANKTEIKSVTQDVVSGPPQDSGVRTHDVAFQNVYC